MLFDLAPQTKNKNKMFISAIKPFIFTDVVYFGPNNNVYALS